MHLKDDILRSSLDNELTEADHVHAEDHLAACVQCQSRLALIQDRSERVSSLIDTLLPDPRRITQGAESAIKRFYEKESRMSSNIPTRKVHPLWVTLAIIAALAVALSFQPVRAFASGVLALFRVQQVSVLSIDISALNSFNRDPTFGEAISQVFSDSIVVTREKEEAQTDLDVESARQLADFPVRFQAGASPSSIILDSGTAFEFTVDLEQAQEILEIGGRSDLELPDNLDGTKFSVDIPASVLATYGECAHPKGSDPDQPPHYRGSTDCIMLMQVPSPTMTASTDVDPSELAEIGLQFIGMVEDEAQALSQSIDWTSTLVIPVPTDAGRHEDITVDGVPGVLIREMGDLPEEELGYTLIWVRDSILYSILGFGDPEQGMALANNLE